VGVPSCRAGSVGLWGEEIEQSEKGNGIGGSSSCIGSGGGNGSEDSCSGCDRRKDIEVDFN